MRQPGIVGQFWCGAANFLVWAAFSLSLRRKQVPKGLWAPAFAGVTWGG